MSNYWNNYYKKNKGVLKPSNFAIFSKKTLKNFSGIICDIGCGNGRDTIYFNKNGFNCYGLDQSGPVIKKNKKKFKKYSTKFIKKNFINFNFSKLNQPLTIYSRFSIHSIKQEKETIFLKKISNLKNLKYIFIEVRTIYDDLYGKGKKIGLNEFVSTHYRRFINPVKFKKKISKKFKIISYKVSKNLAVFKNENPKVLRIVAERKIN